MVSTRTCRTCHTDNIDAIHDMTGQYLLCKDCGHFEDVVPRTTHRASEYRPLFMGRRRLSQRAMSTMMTI